MLDTDSSTRNGIMNPTANLLELAQAANAAHDRFERLAGEALDHAQRAGEALTQAKASLPHGQFESWIKENVSFSARTARSYMRVSANWAAITQWRAVSPDLSLRNAIDLLAAPRAEVPENGSVLPFSLPPIGQMIFGWVECGESMMDWYYIVIEDVSECWVRAAVAGGGKIDFDNWGIRRGRFHFWMSSGEFDYSFWKSIKWRQPLPATAENNPFSVDLPEWKYK